MYSFVQDYGSSRCIAGMTCQVLLLIALAISSTGAARTMIRGGEHTTAAVASETILESRLRSLLQVAEGDLPVAKPDECWFYEHTDFRGRKYGPYKGYVQNVGSDANDKFSSLVCGDDVYVVVSEHGSNGGSYPDPGDQRTYIRYEKNLRRSGFNDKITALNVIPLNRYRATALIKYAHRNYDNYVKIVTGAPVDLPRARLEAMGFDQGRIDEIRLTSGLRAEVRIHDDVRNYCDVPRSLGFERCPEGTANIYHIPRDGSPRYLLNAPGRHLLAQHVRDGRGYGLHSATREIAELTGPDYDPILRPIPASEDVGAIVIRESSFPTVLNKSYLGLPY